MTESTLIGAFVKYARSALPMSFVILRHEDRLSSGYPDISITGNGKTSWIECKFANPKFASKGIQELTLLRLAKAGTAFYVVWLLIKGEDKFTFIVPPNEIGETYEKWGLWIDGFNHQFVVDYVRKVHGVMTITTDRDIFVGAHLTLEQKERFRQEAARRKISMSALFAQIVEEWLDFGEFEQIEEIRSNKRIPNFRTKSSGHSAGCSFLSDGHSCNCPSREEDIPLPFEEK